MESGIKSFIGSHHQITNHGLWTPIPLHGYDFRNSCRAKGHVNPCKGMIFGKWTHAGRRSAWGQFRKMDPCRTEACMGPPHSEILCGAALPGAFFPEKSRSLVLCNLKQCFLHSTKTIFNGTRLDRCGLKNECIRFHYATNLMTRWFKI